MWMQYVYIYIYTYPSYITCLYHVLTYSSSFMPILLDFRPPPTNDVLPLHTLVINLDRRKDRWEGPLVSD